MKHPSTRETAHIFMLRVWLAEQDPSRVERRGCVQALPGGEAYHFRTWDGLVAHLQAMVLARYSAQSSTAPGKGDSQ